MSPTRPASIRQLLLHTLRRMPPSQTATATLLLLLGTLSLPAQNPPAPAGPLPVQPSTAPPAAPALPAFEVASVKPSPPNHGYTNIGPFGTSRFTMTNASLSFIVQMAFDVDQNKLSGKPAWLDSVFFDIIAKAEDDAHLTYEQVKPRLQRLLEQRFHLAAHRDTRTQSGYLLLVGKGAPKLETTKGGAPYGYLNEGKIRLRNAPVESLAGALAIPIGSPVVDKTGIQGNFDFKLDFASETPADPPLPSIFTAIQEQLGLRLEPQKVSIETVVIDHIDRTPTDN